MLSKSTADEIRRVIDADLTRQQLSVGVGSPSTDFCRIWPQTKQVVDLLVHFIPLIPTIGPAAAAGIRALVAIGESAYQNTCVTKPPATTP